MPILHKAIIYTPEHIQNVIASFPHSSFLHDEHGHLPIHVALETGMKWSPLLVSIVNTNTSNLSEVDPVKEFCPAALVALEPSCDLRMITYLLQMHPKHVKVFKEKVSNKPHKLRSCEGHQIKRQKMDNSIFI